MVVSGGLVVPHLQETTGGTSWEGWGKDRGFHVQIIDQSGQWNPWFLSYLGGCHLVHQQRSLFLLPEDCDVGITTLSQYASSISLCSCSQKCLCEQKVLYIFRRCLDLDSQPLSLI